MKKIIVTTAKEINDFANQTETELDAIRAEAIRRLKIKKMIENSKPKN